MPRQSLRQTLLSNINTVKHDAVWGWYFQYLAPIFGDAFYDMFDQPSDDGSDMDIEPPSSDSFADTYSDPLSDDTAESSDSTHSDTYNRILQQCLEILDTLEDSIQNTRRIHQPVPIPRAPQIQLLDEWRRHNHPRFRDKLRVDPLVFDALLNLIQSHPIFASSRQIPVSTQLAIFLNRVGHYGNGLTIADLGDWAGVATGTVHNSCNHVMIAIWALHDIAMSWDLNKPDCADDMEKAKAWVETRSCKEWRNGYVTVDGTCIPLFQKPGAYGETYFDKKKNYSVNCQVSHTTISEFAANPTA